MNMRTHNNYRELKEWIGDIPDHGSALGLQATVDDACRLLSHRSVDEVSGMLDLMADTAEKEADDGVYQLPPPGRGWKLHGTGLWRVITATLSRKSAKALGCEPWECVAAMILYCSRRAVQALRRDPVGIGLRPPVTGQDAQKFAAGATWWLRCALGEKDAGDVDVGRKSREAQRERATKKGLAWREAAIKRWHDRASEFGYSLPKFCGDIADLTLSTESGDTVNVPSYPTVYRVMLLARKEGRLDR